jgi:hypothetical protein
MPITGSAHWCGAGDLDCAAAQGQHADRVIKKDKYGKTNVRWDGMIRSEAQPLWQPLRIPRYGGAVGAVFRAKN